MPIKSYRNQDGTWILWNDDTANVPSTPDQATPAAGSGGSGDIAAQMLEEKAAGSKGSGRAAPQFDRHDRSSFRDMVKQLHKGDLTADQRFGMVGKMVDRGYVTLDDNGDVYSPFPDKHSPEANQSMLDAIREWNDRQNDMFGKAGLDRNDPNMPEPSPEQIMKMHEMMQGFMQGMQPVDPSQVGQQEEQ